MDKNLIVSLKKKDPTATPISTTQPTQHEPKTPAMMFVALSIVVLVLGIGWYVYGSAFFEAVRAPSDLSMSGLSSSTVLRSSGPIVSMTADELMTKVSKLIDLPKDEPTIAVVSDLAPLSNQAFFKNARVGDIVLMFKRSLRAVLYDPELNKIIEVAPITLTD